MKAIALVAVASLTLASCTSTDANTQAAKAFDKVCAAEPPLYASFVTIAEARGTSAKTMVRAEALHTTITGLCANPPTDVVSALVTLTAAYAQFTVLQKQIK